MTALSGKTALVTGASGFIGGAVSRRLHEAGVRVHGVSRRAQAEGGPWDRWWQTDLANIADVRRLFAGAKPDLVFHLAGTTSATRGVESVLPVLHANLVPTVNLLMAAGEHPIQRLVFTGSGEEPEPDGNWPVASSPYAASKFAEGVYIRMCHALYGTPSVILRVFMGYGPAQADVRKLIPYVTCSLLRGEAPALSDGTRGVDWVYIDDIVDAFLAAATADGVEGQTLDIGSGQLVTVREVAERLVQTIRPGLQPRFGSIPQRRLEQNHVADAQRTADCLGWRARTSLGEGLRRTVEWYRHEVLSAEGTPGFQLIGG